MHIITDKAAKIQGQKECLARTSDTMPDPERIISNIFNLSSPSYKGKKNFRSNANVLPHTMIPRTRSTHHREPLCTMNCRFNIL